MLYLMMPQNIQKRSFFDVLSILHILLTRHAIQDSIDVTLHFFCWEHGDTEVLPQCNLAVLTGVTRKSHALELKNDYACEHRHNSWKTEGPHKCVFKPQLQSFKICQSTYFKRS